METWAQLLSGLLRMEMVIHFFLPQLVLLFGHWLPRQPILLQFQT